MAKEALVIKRNTLFERKSFEGFLPISAYDYIEVIHQYSTYAPRGNVLEYDASLKQIIPYVWIINPKTKQVFLYKRVLNANGKKDYYEKRYLNKYSGGVGGHIDRDTEEKAEDPINHAMMRELREEVHMKNYPSPKIVGYLNDDSDALGKVHFGIVAIAETTENVICRNSEGLSSGAFYSLEEVESIFANAKNEVESWTELSWPFVKNYLFGT